MRAAVLNWIQNQKKDIGGKTGKTQIKPVIEQRCPDVSAGFCQGATVLQGVTLWGIWVKSVLELSGQSSRCSCKPKIILK